MVTTECSLGPVMLDLAGPELMIEERELIEHPLVGGVILFARNFESKAQLMALTAAIRETRAHLIIAVDQEGGRVQRFKAGFTHLPPAGELSDYTAAHEAGFTMAHELTEVGVNLSFAPVLDLDHGISEVIGDRSFGATPERVIELGGAYIEGMNKAGMLAVGKHFPGHGYVAADSHVALPVDDREYDEILETDLRPFEVLMPKLGGIMVAHVLYDAVDDRSPTFSSEWLQTILRDRLNFTGAVFSDDLSMAAAGSVGGYAERALMAFTAGCDMLLICNSPEGVVDALEALEQEPRFSPELSLQRFCVHNRREF